MYIIICKSTIMTARPGIITILSDDIGQAVIYRDAEQAEQVARRRSATGYLNCAVVHISQLQFFGNV